MTWRGARGGPKRSRSRYLRRAPRGSWSKYAELKALVSAAGRAEAKTDQDFVAQHRAELGQKALDAARAFVEEHKWKMQSEWGNQLRVVLKATDPAGKQITFEEAATADGTARFTIIAEPGAELSAQRIGAAIWRRLGWVHASPGVRQRQRHRRRLSGPKRAPIRSR